MDTTTIEEAARNVPVLDAVDVLVCGGGLGGISAAMAAARAGARTLLVERNGFLGGVATAGMCCSMFNCFYTASHRLGVTGNAFEVANALADATGYSRRWQAHKGHIIYDVEQAKLVLADLVADAGAQVLLDTVVADTIMDGSHLRGVVVDSKSGRQAILAGAVVDATGDADVAAGAGVPLHTRPAAHRHSYCFRVGQVDVDRFVEYFVSHPDQYPAYMDVDWSAEEALAQYADCGTFLFPHGGAMQMDLFNEAVASGDYPLEVGMHRVVNACQMHALRDRGVVHIITGEVELEALDITQISRAMRDGRRMAFAVTDFFRRRVPGFERAFVVATADDLGIRVSRWLDGEFAFTRAMKERATRFDDVIGRGVVQHDMVKHPGAGAWGVQTFADQTFDIPYRCLLPRTVDGLLVGAGRSVSAEDPWVLRVMALTMVVGQAAGAAAAVAIRTGAGPHGADIRQVQEELIGQNVSLWDKSRPT
jgi:hypothetical protein